MRLYVQKAGAVGFLVFLGLWVTGTLRGIPLDYPMPTPILISSGGEREYSANQQWAHNLKQIGLMETPLPLILDKPEAEQIRIHEKRAVLAMSTTAFNADQAKIRASITEYKADIFTEKNTGIEPGRRLTLEIGVHPDRFDALVDQLRTIANLSSITVEQKDRSGEFRALNAKRQSAKKYLESIMELRKNKSGSLDDSLKLEAKIQEIERELQGLSVQFGDLLGKESYYHVHVTLVEHQPGDQKDRTYTIPQRIGHGFLWAIVWWFGVVLACVVLAGACVSVWVLKQKPTA